MKHVLRISLAVVALIGIISCEQSAQIDSLASGQGSGGPSGGTGLEDAIIGTYNSQTETSTLIHSQAEWADAFQTAVNQELDLIAVLDTVYIQDDFVPGEDTVVLVLEGELDSEPLFAGITLIKAGGDYSFDNISVTCKSTSSCNSCKVRLRDCPCADKNKESQYCDYSRTTGDGRWAAVGVALLGILLGL